VRARPQRLDRLPEQYFAALLARVAAAAARDGEVLIDLGRGNPDIGPPPHVAEALCAAARRSDTHGYAPFAGLPSLKEAIAARYRDVYEVDVDPEREVAVLPGAKTGLMEFAQVCVERGDAIVLPDPGYPDYRSAVALAAAQHVPLPLPAAESKGAPFTLYSGTTAIPSGVDHRAAGSSRQSPRERTRRASRSTR